MAPIGMPCAVAQVRLARFEWHMRGPWNPPLAAHNSRGGVGHDQILTCRDAHDGHLIAASGQHAID